MSLIKSWVVGTTISGIKKAGLMPGFFTMKTLITQQSHQLQQLQHLLGDPLVQYTP